MQRIYRCVLFAMLSMGVLVPSAWGGGAWLYEMGTPDLGTAGAGRAAMGADASTAGINPAMTHPASPKKVQGVSPIDKGSSKSVVDCCVRRKALTLTPFAGR